MCAGESWGAPRSHRGQAKGTHVALLHCPGRLPLPQTEHFLPWKPQVRSHKTRKALQMENEILSRAPQTTKMSHGSVGKTWEATQHQLFCLEGGKICCFLFVFVPDKSL